MRIGLERCLVFGKLGLPHSHCLAFEMTCLPHCLTFEKLGLTQTLTFEKTDLLHCQTFKKIDLPQSLASKMT